MSKHAPASAVLRVLGVGIALVQLFDILIHAITNQLELIRVISNVIILLWLGSVSTGKFGAKFPQTAFGAIGAISAYLVLNIIFLALEGVTNAVQGGGLRVMLFLLVFMTTILSSLLAYLLGQRE